MAPREGVTVVSTPLELLFQKTTNCANDHGESLREKANELLAGHAMFIRAFSSPRLVAYPSNYDDRFDTASLRKAAEKAHPGAKGVLRVITTNFAPTTTRGATEGEDRAEMSCEPFIILNGTKDLANSVTLLHEMIHAALYPWSGHDSRADNIFFEADNGERHVFSREYADRMRRAFFARQK